MSEGEACGEVSGNRFKRHWPELREHLREDTDSREPRTELRLHKIDDLELAREESRRLLDMELAGSGSLNTRGTQLAGLSAATIAIVAATAERWIDASSGGVAVAIAVLMVLAMVALLVAVYCALFAVLPTSRWRKTLEDALGEDLATLGEPEERTKDALDAKLGQRYLTMAEYQRVRNQHKADDMLLAYSGVGLGVLCVFLAAMTFLVSRAVCV